VTMGTTRPRPLAALRAAAAAVAAGVAALPAAAAAHRAPQKVNNTADKEGKPGVTTHHQHRPPPNE
jgi:hypothetical protein